ncbi:hypothetical protein C7974DRAFT_376947 [Boeremia exigua]|uniref:uncharacterized protein n=1 Tax=Boeremia exigua TaxID=749465 RepID=UPI001E8DCAC3|nr:uncharacterized protein C7974DRAFT_376947 [Boeremia exigua]KAH6625434.1 hypothetical protein C7974DRAFT_376947 [Boeremia exigua]
MSGISSSLLQLPPNIRDRIWTYAYGNLIIHAEPACSDQKMTTSGHYAFRYELCQQPSLSSGSSRMPDCCPGCQRTPFFWPIVSKQFWSETTETFYKSAAFKVRSSIDLYILASSQQQSVRRVRNLEVQLGFGIRHHNRIWSPARCHSVIINFANLQGLTLLIGLVVEDDSNYTGTCISYDSNGGVVTRGSRLEGYEWQLQRNWFPLFLRAFQQHQLQPALTRVALIDRKKQRQSPVYHEKDRRWQQDPYSGQRKDEAIQAARKKELEARMKAVLLAQNIRLLFPDWEAENKRILEEESREHSSSS